MVEAVTDVVIDWASYTGYQQTIVALVLLLVVYWISRTQFWRAAAILAVVVTSVAIFLSGWGEPRGVAGGLFDFLIPPAMAR